MTELDPFIIPAFSSEADEAAWWDSNQALIEDRFLRAEAAGALGHGRAVSRAVAARNAATALTLEIPEPDLTRARARAVSRGLGFQAYLQLLIHEGLDREEQPA